MGVISMKKIGTDKFGHEYYHDPLQGAIWVTAGYITYGNFKRGVEEGLIIPIQDYEKLLFGELFTLTSFKTNEVETFINY